MRRSFLLGIGSPTLNKAFLQIYSSFIGTIDFFCFSKSFSASYSHKFVIDRVFCVFPRSVVKDSRFLWPFNFNKFALWIRFSDRNFFRLVAESNKKIHTWNKTKFLLFDGLKREKKRIKGKRIESEFVWL